MHQLDIYRLQFGLNGNNKINWNPSRSGASFPVVCRTGRTGRYRNYRFWVDVLDARQQTIYRQFINKGLPINADFTCRDWSQLRRRKFRVEVQIPVLYNAHSIVLFEQYLAQPEDRRSGANTSRRFCHKRGLLPSGNCFGRLCVTSPLGNDFLISMCRWCNPI